MTKLPLVKGLPPNASKAFVALESSTGIALEKIKDDPENQAEVARVVLGWARSGAKVLYTSAELAELV